MATVVAFRGGQLGALLALASQARTISATSWASFVSAICKGLGRILTIGSFCTSGLLKVPNCALMLPFSYNVFVLFKNIFRCSRTLSSSSSSNDDDGQSARDVQIVVGVEGPSFNGRTTVTYGTPFSRPMSCERERNADSEYRNVESKWPWHDWVQIRCG